MADHEQAGHFRFETVGVEYKVSRVRRIGRLVGGAITQALFPSEREGNKNPFTDLPDWSAVLYTDNGLLKLERNEWLGNTLRLLYPDSAHPLPTELVADVFAAEPGELHTVFQRFDEGGSEDYTAQTGSFKLPDTDEAGRHFWLEFDQRRIREMDAGEPVEQMAVFDGEIGELRLAHRGVHNIALHRGYDRPYVEEEPAMPTPEALRGISDRFKQLTIAVANQLGGARQITAPYEQGDLSPSYAHQSAHNIASRWMLRGYSVSQGERKPGENTEPGFEVLEGTKESSWGVETVVAEAGLSTFYYTRGLRKWRFTWGVVLKQAATVKDLEAFLPE